MTCSRQEKTNSTRVIPRQHQNVYRALSPSIQAIIDRSAFSLRKMVGTCGTLTPKLAFIISVISASLFSGAIAAPVTPAPVTPAPVTNSSCPPDFYLDHGTGMCEYCYEICVGATHRGTENDCQQLCPAYAKKILNNEVKHPESRVLTPQPAQSSPETGGSLSQAVKIGTGTSIALGLLILCVVAFKYREKIARRLRSNSSPSRSAIYQVTSQDDTDAPIIPTTLSSSACSFPRKIHGQETEDGRCGTQAMALIGPGQDPVDRDQVVPKVVP